MHKITIKPWGQETLIELNMDYMVKILRMKMGHCCSLQYHEFKHETIFVISGCIHVQYGEDKDNLTEDCVEAGHWFIIEPGMIHRMSAPHEDSEYLEAATTYPDDLIRLEDKYGRT